MDDNDSDHDGSEVDEENFDGSEMEFDISDEDTDIEANQGWYKLQYCFRLCLGIAWLLFPFAAEFFSFEKKMRNIMLTSSLNQLYFLML